MLRTFCAASNFKILIHRHEDMPVVRKFSSFIEKATEDHSCDGLAGAITNKWQTPSPVHLGKRGQIELPQRAKQALESLFIQESLPELACLAGYVVNKLQFKIQVKSARDSAIFFLDPALGHLSPGSLLYVVSVASNIDSDHNNPTILCIVRGYLPANYGKTNSVLTSHPEFGAQLFDTMSDSPWIAISSKDIICHAIGREWTKGVMVLKPLDRVRTFNSIYRLTIAC